MIVASPDERRNTLEQLSASVYVIPWTLDAFKTILSLYRSTLEQQELCLPWNLSRQIWAPQEPKRKHKLAWKRNKCANISICRHHYIVLSMLIHKEYVSCFKYELLRSQPCWLALCQWRTEKNGYFGIWYFCHTWQSCLWRHQCTQLCTKWQHSRLLSKDRKWTEPLLCLLVCVCVCVCGEREPRTVRSMVMSLILHVV